MVAAAVVVALAVPVAVPVVFTVRAEPETERALARGAAPFATVRLTVMLSPVFAMVPPPTVLAAVMLLVVRAAGLTELTVKLLVNGHELHESPGGGVPVSDTDMVPLPGVADGVTVQSKVWFAVPVRVGCERSAVLVHPAGRVRVAVRLVHVMFAAELYTKCTVNGWETFMVPSVAPAGDVIARETMFSWRLASVNVTSACMLD